MPALAREFMNIKPREMGCVTRRCDRPSRAVNAQIKESPADGALLITRLRVNRSSDQYLAITGALPQSNR